MKKVIIASENPVKINAVSLGFKKLFPKDEFEFSGVSADSGVSDQPTGDDETFTGAKNRAEAAMKLGEGCDYYVGLEGGVLNSQRGTEVFAWIYILNAKGQTGLGRTGSFYLPKSITELLEKGMELGSAADIVFDESNSKQNSGSVGLLTNDAVDRTNFYIDAVVFALIPFNNEELYF